MAEDERDPLIGVVVVNYRATALTMACVESLMTCEWPRDRLRLMVVDNSDDPELARLLSERFPAVQHRASGGNVGFAEACNIGMRHFASVDHLALVNNDAVVDPGWLRPLVDALDEDPRIGAAVPKILFAPQFIRVRSEGEGIVTGLRVDGIDVLDRAQPAGGVERRPDPDRLGSHHLHVRPGSEVLAPVPEGTVAPWSVVVGTDRGPETCVTVDGPSVPVINNFGTELREVGFGADRCFRHVDDGTCDEPTDVFSFSGGGVLLRRRFLDEAGLFDGRFFTYYEDLDLAWRGRQHGWRYRTVPGATLRHVHTATTVEGSASFVFHNERNRLLTLVRNGSPGAVVGALVRHARGTLGLIRHDLLGSGPGSGRAAGRRLWIRCLAFVSFLLMVPATLSTRRGEAGRRIGHSPLRRRSQPLRDAVMRMDRRDS